MLSKCYSRILHRDADDVIGRCVAAREDPVGVQGSVGGGTRDVIHVRGVYQRWTISGGKQLGCKGPLTGSLDIDFGSRGIVSS